MQSSDLFLQYLRKDLDGKWTNKHIFYDDNDDKNQQVMMVDELPYVISKDNININNIEKKLWDLIYSELI